MPARIPRPSCPADHDHAANSACYLHHRCGCTPCREAQNERARSRRRQLAYGRWDRGFVDAAPVREHLDYLRRNGMGVRVIQARSGVPRITLSRLIWGIATSEGNATPNRRVRASTAAALLALQPDLALLADHACIDGRGTRRRLQALARCGWTFPAIARATNTSPHTIANLSVATRVTARSARLISAIYDQLWNVPPPTSTPTQRSMFTRSRRHAIQKRWPGPLSWDDIDRDATPARRHSTDEDADETQEDDGVDPVAVQLATEGHHVRLTPAERRAAVRILHAAFYSDGVVADRIGCDIKTIERIRGELELPAHDDADLRITRSVA
ncbi:hypothetical protein [Microbacterium maritypicum]